MIVPRYWAEARQQARQGRRQVTVRRFGWSDDSLVAAEAHARARVEEALAAILAGAELPRRELRTAYGEAGVPIREEIVERAGDVVLTRNSYGALCLNVADVLFADIDLETPPQRGLVPLPALALLAVVGGAVAWAASWWLGAIAAIAALLACNRAHAAWTRRRYLAGGTPEQRARARIDAFVAAHPDWHLRLYRTPAGFRLLAMHRCFSPDAAEVAACFAALGVDPVFAHLCRMQHCFRARVSAKPWRIGIGDKIRPRYAAWREEQALLPERQAWIARYQQRSAGFAACRHLASFGEQHGSTERTRQVADWHDALCRALRGDLPLA